MDNELIFKLQGINQQFQEIEEKLKIVVQQLSELEEFSLNLDEIEKNKSKEILASLGKGVYLKSEIKEDKFFVDVGSGVLIRKTPKEAKEVLNDQIKKMNGMKIQLIVGKDSVEEEMKLLIEKAGE